MVGGNVIKRIVDGNVARMIGGSVITVMWQELFILTAKKRYWYLLKAWMSERLNRVSTSLKSLYLFFNLLEYLASKISLKSPYFYKGIKFMSNQGIYGIY